MFTMENFDIEEFVKLIKEPEGYSRYALSPEALVNIDCFMEGMMNHIETFWHLKHAHDDYKIEIIANMIGYILRNARRYDRDRSGLYGMNLQKKYKAVCNNSRLICFMMTLGDDAFMTICHLLEELHIPIMEGTPIHGRYARLRYTLSILKLKSLYDALVRIDEALNGYPAEVKKTQARAKYSAEHHCGNGGKVFHSPTAANKDIISLAVEQVSIIDHLW